MRPDGDDEGDAPALPTESTVIVRSDYVRRERATERERRRHLLVRSDRTRLGEVVVVDGVSVVLGRAPQCDVVLDGEGVSRTHARLDREGDGYAIEDLGSANGTWVNGVQVVRQALLDGDVVQLGPLVGFRYTVTDDQHEETLRQLYEASVRDALTGAFNREYLSERLRGELAFARRHKTEVAVLLLDLDHFKNVNDTHGHPAGDAVLVSVASAIRSQLRTEDILARFGGEEFVVVLRGAPLQAARITGERIRQTLEALPIVFEGKRIPVTASVGCASVACCEAPSPDAIIAVADRRLYEAKRAGRNRVVAQG